MDKNVPLSASENIWVSSSLVSEIYTNTTTHQEKDYVCGYRKFIELTRAAGQPNTAFLPK